MESKIRQRIFVVGCPRSGTTLLQGLLAAHRDVTSFKETFFFNLGIKKPFKMDFHYVSNRAPKLVHQLLETSEINESLKHQLIARMPSVPVIPGLGLKYWVYYFGQVLDEIAKSRNKYIWLEKTPDHLMRIELIEKFLEKTRFIHIIRDGGDTIASLYRGSSKWDRQFSIDECIRIWNAAIKKSIQRLKLKRDLFIYYRSLAEDPTLVIHTLFYQLGLSSKNNILDRYQSVLPSVIGSEEEWKQKTFKKIEFQSSFPSVFSKEEQAYIKQNINTHLFNQLITQIS